MSAAPIRWYPSKIDWWIVPLLCLPPAVLSGMKPDGGMDLAGVLASLARDPRQLPSLIRTGREAERAFKALDHARRLLGPRLGRADLGELLLDVG